MSVVYRDRDRYDDNRTSVSTNRRDGGGYTTVKRYIVKDDDSRSTTGRDRRFVPERAGERVEETRIVRREREVEEPIREPRREDPRFSTSELVIRRDRDDEPRRDLGRDLGYDRRRDDRSSEREVIIRRTAEVDEPRRDYRFDNRYRDDYEVVSPNRGGFDDRDVQRYTRNTEYYAPAPPPQTIVIRQEPIIIRERVRDDDYQIVRKSDIDDERSVVRRDRDGPRGGGEEEYFYEKKIRERIDDPRRDDDDYSERRITRREVSPHDSVSQVGRRRGSYSSDDSMVYVRKTKEYSESGSDDGDRRKNLAAGVIAGVGAAELLRNHKKKEGRDTSHGIGRVGRDLGAGAIGAIAAEGISRARSEYRSKSRRRGSRSRSRRRSRSRSRSRSGSRSRLKTLGVVGLGAVALAAAAAVAQKKMGDKKEGSPPRGRDSSTRRESVDELANDPNADDARNPKHRNKRMAEVGAAGAAITALIDHQRNKSRGRDRSQSRVRQAVPIVAAGLGSAALAGLYEKNKAKKEAETIVREDRRRSRSRSRRGSEYYDDRSASAAGPAPGMIEYGDGPMYGNNYGADYYGRPLAAPSENYYGSQSAVVPAMAGGAAGYGAAREARSRSLSRDRGRRSVSRSSSSSPGGHRSRRQQSRDNTAGPAAGTAATGTAIGGPAAAAEHERKKQEKRERKARRREERYGAHDPYEDAYNPNAVPYTPTPPPPPGADPYGQQTGYYPQASQFPPPPGSGPQQYAPAPGPPPGGYTPQNFPPPPPGMQSTAPNYDPYVSGGNPYAAPRTRGTEENVSVPSNSQFGNSFPQNTPNDQHHMSNGVNNTRDMPTPIINVQSPSVASTTSYPISPQQAQPTYVPPTDRARSSPSPVRSNSQPPPSGPRKSVQFAEKPDIQTLSQDSEASSPEHVRTRHRDRVARGYEAGDDTDSTPDETRHRYSQPRNGIETTSRGDPNPANDLDEGLRRHHHRRRSHEPNSQPSGSSSITQGRSRANSSTANPNSSSHLRPPRDGTISPAESDATVELPARFDDKGRKKAEPGDDPLTDKLNDIIAGKGTAGKVFGNFIGGLFGPDGKRKKR